MDLPPCNFRPILPKIDSRQQPNIYRSNSLDDGTTNSCLWLCETMGIRSYVDLREDREFRPDCKLGQYFTPTNPKIRPGKSVNIQDNSGFMFHIKFISFTYYLKVIAYRLSWRQIFNVLTLLIRHLFRKDYEYQKYGGSCYVNPLGIGGFYCILLEDCTSIFGTLFSVMAHKEYFPMLISCSLGKDRTGIVSAILMQLSGFSNEDIVQEYARSERLLLSMKEEIHRFFEQRGVNGDFEGSPANAMEQLLNFLKEKYGGAEGYLRHCGLLQTDIDNIKRNIQHRTPVSDI